MYCIVVFTFINGGELRSIGAGVQTQIFGMLTNPVGDERLFNRVGVNQSTEVTLRRLMDSANNPQCFVPTYKILLRQVK